MKKRFCILICVIVIISIIGVVSTICLKNANEYNVKSYITDDIRNNCKDLYADLCLAYEYTPQVVTSYADNIVLATVISIDSMNPSEGLFGTTNGKILIQESLKGNLEEGQVVQYLKNGGIMTMEDWEKNQPQASIDKRNYLRQQSNVEKSEEYVNICLSDDIEIHEGYTYLINLKKLDDRYEIVGLGQGLREVNINYTSRVSYNGLDTNTLKIKNNKTNEFESLQLYINTYINNNEVE